MNATSGGKANRGRPRKKMRRSSPAAPDTIVPLCHVCGCDPSSLPLEFLDSLWRVVLICPRCLISLHSPTICTYCFKPLPTHGGLSCCRCGRSVHPGCFPGGPPSPDQFVCLDCWMPRGYANRYKGTQASVFGERTSKLERAVETLCCDAEKVTDLAVKAREIANIKMNMAVSMAQSAKTAANHAAKVGMVKSSISTLIENICAPKGFERYRYEKVYSRKKYRKKTVRN